MEIDKPSIFVLDENTLGYVYKLQPGSFWPLAANVHGYDWKNGSVGISSKSNLRKATQADFDKFRVCSKGYLPLG